MSARRKERVRDFFGCQPTHLTQRKSDLGVGTQRRVAAREDQSKPIVFHAVLLVVGRIRRLDALQR